jgi:hypothetical protein
MATVVNGLNTNYSRFIKFILGAVVLVWLASVMARVVGKIVFGVDVDVPTDLANLAGVTIGALINLLMSPRAEGEQEIAKLEATAAIANAAPAVAAEVLKPHKA